jgi:hypothetical protein
VLKNFESEGELMSGAVNNWSVFVAGLLEVIPTHQHASNNRVHISGSVSKDKVLPFRRVFKSGIDKVFLESVHSG